MEHSPAEDLPDVDEPATLHDIPLPVVQSRPSPVGVAATTLDDSGYVTRYQVRAPLGQGGMGEVRLCRDRRIGRDVAIKVIRSEHRAREDVRDRFLREARVQGQLEHPSVVPVYDLGLGPDGATYFTMKRVRGLTLSSVIASLRQGDPSALSRFSRRRLLSAFETVCQTVEFAHARGVIHRDLKPDNIMLGDFGEVYVLDWGVARLTDLSECQDTASPERVRPGLGRHHQTLVGAAIGTPGYMAPEQISEEFGPLDHRADVYALGAILFEVLTLEPLHAEANPELVMSRTLQGCDARARARAPERDLAPELEDVCLRATALEARDRYARAEDLREAVERYLDGDLDLTRRRAMVTEHLEAAEAHLARSAISGSHAERANAVREVGRALALDPNDTRSLQTLVGLLRAPKEIPAEVLQELEAANAEQIRVASKAGGRAYLGWFLLSPLVLWMGVQDWVNVAISAALTLTSAALAYYLSRSERPSARVQYVAMVVSTLGIASTYRILGPFIVVPCIVAINTMVFQLSPASRGGPWWMLFGCLGIALPVALEWTGALPPTMVFREGGVQIVPRVLGLPETATFVYLLVSHLAMVIMAARIFGRIRDSLMASEQRMLLQSWQLRQLMPEEARHVTSIPGPVAPAECRL